MATLRKRTIGDQEQPADGELSPTSSLTDIVDINSEFESGSDAGTSLGSYGSDTSDEDEDTLGNIPRHWYDEYDHMGYDRSGNKIKKGAQTSAIDDYFNAKGVIVDGKEYKLSADEIELLKKIESRQLMAPEEDQIEFFSGVPEIMPLSGAHEPKRRFIPSKSEARMIMKIAAKLKNKPPPVIVKEGPYDLWEESGTAKPRIMAPKIQLPLHSESYNPPAEYLFSKKEEEEYLELDPEDRPLNYIPQKYDSLRQVKGYPRFLQERFARCLDLYLCPRTVKQKMNIDPESLIPNLPSPRDLKPFPTKLSIVYKGHVGRIRCCSIDPSGQWMASGGVDNTVRIWEVVTGRNVRTFKFDDQIMAVEWNPSQSISILAVSCDNNVIMINPGTASDQVQDATKSMICCNSLPENAVSWKKPDDPNYYVAIDFDRVKIINKRVTSISWHRKGDYFATTSPDGQTKSIHIHQLSKGTSQAPFKKNLGIIVNVIFHPTRPYLFVLTQTAIRLYNLTTQELVRKLLPGAKFISSGSVHFSGDHLLIGTYEGKAHWFDLDLSTRPYKTLRHHSHAVRQVAFHNALPLAATASDDGEVLVLHAGVKGDFEEAVIVPVRKLEHGREVKTIAADEEDGVPLDEEAKPKVLGLGILDCIWHPRQPWLITAGADGVLKLFV